jgi:hypothetical protein
VPAKHADRREKETGFLNLEMILWVLCGRIGVFPRDSGALFSSSLH